MNMAGKRAKGNGRRAEVAEWKKFENFVGEIERIVAPQGARVKINDQIHDRFGNPKPRQVDASVRIPRRDGTEELTILECRKRKKINDVTWIEQIFGKRDSLAAARAIVVTNRPISQPAQVVAREHSIELRVLDETKPTDLFMPRILSLGVRTDRTNPRTIQVEFCDKLDNLAEVQGEMTGVLKDDLDRPVLRIAENTPPMSVRAIWEDFRQRSGLQMLIEGHRAHEIGMIREQNPGLALMLPSGTYSLNKAVLIIDEYAALSTSQLEREGSYSSDKRESKLYVAQHSVQTAPKTIIVTGVGDPDDQSLTYSFTEGSNLGDLFRDADEKIEKLRAGRQVAT